MRTLRFASLTAFLLMGLVLLPQESSAWTSFGFSIGYHGGYYPYGYHHYYRPYYYRPYYYGYGPYFGGFYSPYHYGFAYPGYYYGSYAGEIRTEVKPQEARVYVDGYYAGKADDFDGWWQRLEVEPGAHRLTFRCPGYAPYVVDVSLAPGQDTHVKYDMHPGEDQIADLEMRLPESERPRDRGYDRYQGDRYNRGYDPYKRRQPPPPSNDYGYRDRRPNDDGYRERPYPDQQESERPYFESPGRDSVRSELVMRIEPPDATVYVDGNYYGTANENGRGELRVLLPEGVHRIEVVRPGYRSFSQDVNVSRNDDNNLTITLERK